MSDLTIDFSARFDSTRPAVFTTTMVAGIMTDWVDWAPSNNRNKHTDFFPGVHFRIYINDILCFDDEIVGIPKTFVAPLDGTVDNQVKFWAQGIEFLPAEDGHETRAGLILTDITVEQYSIVDYITQQLSGSENKDFKWPTVACAQYNRPVVLVENGYAEFAVASPIYQWLLKIDKSRLS